VIKELRATPYRPRMTVLASRDHYCIHPSVRESSKKDTDWYGDRGLGGIRSSSTALAPSCSVLMRSSDPCSKKLVAQRSCGFHNLDLAHNRQLMPPYGKHQVWDIEDLVRLGKVSASCPYFGARHLAAEAVFIVCPYNYLLDPCTSVLRAA